MSHVTTHVLDTAAGRPAAGIPVLEKALVDAKVPLPPKKMM